MWMWLGKEGSLDWLWLMVMSWGMREDVHPNVKNDLTIQFYGIFIRAGRRRHCTHYRYVIFPNPQLIDASLLCSIAISTIWPSIISADINDYFCRHKISGLFLPTWMVISADINWHCVFYRFSGSGNKNLRSVWQGCPLFLPT
jgi:hypothetical protein